MTHVATHRRQRFRRLIAGYELLETRQLLAGLLDGFVETPIAVGLTRPIAMAIAPDGRIFVAEQNGAIRIVKNDALLPRPFAKLDTNTISESGLIGIALDPNFASNHYVYVQYTTSPFGGAALHNRISRFTANGDVVVAGSEKVLYELDNHTASFHMGGAVHFGGDGKLYFTTGDNGTREQVPSLSNTFGKILRINRDGSIPSDNPFYSQASGKYRAIWAIGFRNPYTFAVQPGTGRIFVNDVGRHAYEEINDVVKGANYGWPATEGPTTNAAYKSPLFAYGHDSPVLTGGAAIAGGAFYNPQVQQFADKYRGDYFFADYGAGDIYALDIASKSVTVFADGIPWTTQPIDLAVDSGGSLYYLTLGDGHPSGGAITRITTANKPPVLKLSGDVTYTEGSTTVRIAPTGAVSDPDTADYSGGKLTARIVSGAQAADRLAVRDNGYVTLSGSTIRVDGVLVGSFSGGSGATALIIYLNAAANPGRVGAVLRNITYLNVSDNPAVMPRTVSVRLEDGHGVASTAQKVPINITAINDAPLLGNTGGNLGYTRDAPAILLVPYATLKDADSANFDGGRLTVSNTAGGESTNRQQIGGAFSFSSGKLLHSGVAIGTIVGNGIGLNKLQFAFNSQATAAVVQELLRTIRFRTTIGASAGDRAISLWLSDGDGGTSTVVRKTVTVS
jgi:glucose/arabinose dehydrogenase